MVDVILKNILGQDVTYSGIDTVKLKNTEGGEETFSHGIAVEDVEITPDFSAGNQTVTAEEGQLIKSATIQMPDTLLPENIAEGIDIAGVVGTLVAGGGGAVFATGTFTGNNSTTANTITHGLGVVPDLIVIQRTVSASTYLPTSSTKQYIVSVCGVSTAFKTAINLSVNHLYVIAMRTSSSAEVSKLYSMTNTFTNGIAGSEGVIYNATADTFKVGGSVSGTYLANQQHTWIAIGGLT